jgi:ABC-2 type transport system ATP-binding protein
MYWARHAERDGYFGGMGEFLVVDNLVKNYGPHRALDGVSFSVESGECFGLLGPNGAGKTTLLSIISCLRAADAGTATLMSERLTPENRRVRSAIGFAPQEIAVYGSLTARENLRFFGELYGMPSARLAERVDHLLEAVGLTSKAETRAETFSGGMLRRLNFAAALVHEPKLLLLDEPTAGVDPQSRNHLFEEIRRVNRAGTTILYTTHYMEEVEVLCNRVAIMDRGKLVACDALPNLLGLMSSTVRIRLPGAQDGCLRRLQAIPDAQVTGDGQDITIAAPGTAAVLLQVVRVLGECGIQPESLAAESPNLERVFLHLTGRALRD